MAAQASGAVQMSIVLPHYNQGELVSGALDTVWAQSSAPDRLVVVDDGSDERNLALLTTALAGRDGARFIRHRRNLGVSAACRTGLGEVESDFVGFLAGDDRLSPGMVEEARRAALLAPEAGIIFSDPADLGVDGEHRVLSLALSEQTRFFTPAEFERILSRSFFFIRTENVWFNVAALRELGGFDDRLRWHADLFAAYALGLRFGATYVPKALSFFRRSPDSYSASGRRSSEQVEVIRAWLARTREPAGWNRRAAFRRAALLPDYTSTAVTALRSDPGFVTARLLTRLLIRSAWDPVRRFVPWRLRQIIRRVVSSRARSR